jgi:ABC-type multidrug transport system fused ATPase/permease subunit
MEYFQDLGYACPHQVDEADFLQELPTPEGRRFIKVAGAPHSAKDLAAAWKKSSLYQQLLTEMRYPTLEDAKKLEKSNTKLWYLDQLQHFAGSFRFYFELLLDRQMKIVMRNSTFVKARIGQVLLVGAISGSLFNNIAVTDVSTMNGFLFNSMLFAALGSFSILPIIYAQKAVYYKQKDSLFFPTSAFCLAQTISFFPLQVLESVFYILIVYWSADLSHQYRGSRFLTFIVVSLVFSMTISQLFRVIAAFVPDIDGALPIAGIIIVIMVLFSGFIQPKALISDGWSWFYWMNPVAWALKAVTVNEFKSEKYDFLTCTNPTCTEKSRFGDFVLEQYGNPTDEAYIWYSFAVLVAEYLFLFLLTFLSLKYIRTEPTPPAPIRATTPVTEHDHEHEHADLVRLADTVDVGDIEAGVTEATSANETNGVELTAVAHSNDPSGKSLDSNKASSARGSNRLVKAQLPFDPISFAFKDIWYTVTLSSGEDVDLLRGVNGYFEPGTVTALMGSSGAGKTTLLDVLAGRKNTGVVKGEMYLNGVPKVEGYFRKIMGYVEQFDTLPQKSTARECAEFSAALRLASNITADQRQAWVNAVLHMMDLEPIEDMLVSCA